MIKIILKDDKELVYDCNMLNFTVSTKNSKNESMPMIYICNSYSDPPINVFFADEIEQILILENKKKDKARLKDDVKALKESVELQREDIRMLNERIETLEKNGEEKE